MWTNIVGTVERSRVAALLDVRLEDPVPKLPKGSPWTKFKAAVYTRARWKQVGYCWLRLPVSGVLFAIVVGAWALSLAMVALPAYVAALPRDTAQLGLFGISQGPAAWLAAVLGAVGLVAAAPWLTLLAGRLDTALARWLLGPPPDEQAGRAGREGRDAAGPPPSTPPRPSAAASSATCTTAPSSASSPWPWTSAPPASASRPTPRAARRSSPRPTRRPRPPSRRSATSCAASTPSSSRTAASTPPCPPSSPARPIPVELTVDLPERPPAAVESAAYFVVSEALANIARHAHATRAHVGIVRTGDTLIVEVRDDGVGGADPVRGTGLRGLADRVVGLGGTHGRAQPGGRPDDRAGGAPMRILIAEDSVLLRAGLTRLLLDAGEDVIASVGDADQLMLAVERHQPDLAVVDVRMPPTNTDDGLRAALEIRARWPEIGILVLQPVRRGALRHRAARRPGASADGTGGLGYLLKDRVADVADFLVAVRRVGEGGTALDPEVVAQLLARSRQRDPLAALSPREREVLGAHGRGPLELRHRRDPRREREHRREARHQHLHQARPAPRRPQPPPCARRAAVAGGLGRPRRSVSRARPRRR